MLREVMRLTKGEFTIPLKKKALPNAGMFYNVCAPKAKKQNAEYMSNQELAQKLGVSCSSIARYEKEGILPKAFRPTTKKTLYKIAEVEECLSKGSDDVL